MARADVPGADYPVYFTPYHCTNTLKPLQRLLQEINTRCKAHAGRLCTCETILVVDSKKHVELLWAKFESQTLSSLNEALAEITEDLGEALTFADQDIDENWERCSTSTFSSIPRWPSRSRRTP